MHHALDHQIHAVGTPVLERIHRTMRTTTAGFRTKYIFLRHQAARQEGMSWHGRAGRMRHGIAGTGPLDEGKRARSGFGLEVVSAVAEWAHKTFGKESFIYPVAVQNTASRRIADRLHDEIIENRRSPKYESVVYKIPWKG